MCDHPANSPHVAKVIAAVVALQAHMAAQALPPGTALDVLMSAYLNAAHVAGLTSKDVEDAFNASLTFYDAVFAQPAAAPIAATSTIQ